MKLYKTKDRLLLGGTILFGGLSSLLVAFASAGLPGGIRGHQSAGSYHGENSYQECYQASAGQDF